MVIWNLPTLRSSGRNLLPASVIPELYYFIWYLDGIAVQKVDVHMCVVVLVHILGICFNTISWTFFRFYQKIEVGRACFFQPGPSRAKIFLSRASLELLNFCFKPLRAKKFCTRAYFKPKNTSVYLTTTLKLGSH